MLFSLLLLTAVSPACPALRVSPNNNSGPSNGIIGVWNSIKIVAAHVHSRRSSQLNSDCTHLGAAQSEVECFSIQQNFWVSNSHGDMVLWVQNVVQLAELADGIFFATYAFLVWNSKDPLQPLLCDPSSLSEDVCRAPIYTDPVRFPQSFPFYANISGAGGNYVLHVSNGFAARSWTISTSIGCPCFIDVLRQTQPPWGYFPFEFVVVGLDNDATAYFEEGTMGSVSRGMVQSVDGSWRLATINTLSCNVLSVCSNAPSTGEASMNMRWDNDSGNFYWSKGSNDQGIYFADISSKPAQSPNLPYPIIESYLYIRMDLRDLAVPTVFDNQDRATGYDASTGKFVNDIPQSFLTLSGEVGIIIVHPNGSYKLTLTPLGSGPYHLLVSKQFNNNGTKYSTVLDSTINAIEPKQILLNSDTMTVISKGNIEPSLIMFGAVLVWVTIIAGILLWRRKRRLSSTSAAMEYY